MSTSFSNAPIQSEQALRIAAVADHQALSKEIKALNAEGHENPAIAAALKQERQLKQKIKKSFMGQHKAQSNLAQILEARLNQEPNASSLQHNEQ